MEITLVNGNFHSLYMIYEIIPMVQYYYGLKKIKNKKQNFSLQINPQTKQRGGPCKSQNYKTRGTQKENLGNRHLTVR